MHPSTRHLPDEDPGHPDRPPRRNGLTAAFRKRTGSLHAQAERSGIIRELLHGRASAFGYALYLRNLLPAYREMEQGLEQQRDAPGVGVIAQPALYRARAIESDLVTLCGQPWRALLPLLGAGERYASRVKAAGEGDGARLLAHAYVRYLGDLSGGQILGRLLGRSLGLGSGTPSFHKFPDIADLEGFKLAYRDAINRAAAAMIDVEPVIEEAAVAFQLNMDVSEAVHAVPERVDGATPDP
ncbi:MAG: biliverdin-producing heme oxygenase [Gammaproteobacteria bacterium]